MQKLEAYGDYVCGASHMNDNRQMSVAMQRLVDFISMVIHESIPCAVTVQSASKSTNIQSSYMSIHP
jgi:hypothetical protein